VSRVVRDLDQQVLLVTHHLELLEGFDRVLVFDETKLVFDGPVEPALDHYRRLMA
jgi:biotin transport system ATP-binding protein